MSIHVQHISKVYRTQQALKDVSFSVEKGEIVLEKPMDELANDTAQIVEVEFDYKIEMVTLKRLPKVSKVENTVGFVYQIRFTTEKDMCGKVFDFAHENGLKILQLHCKNAPLEKLFVDLTNQK